MIFAGLAGEYLDPVLNPHIIELWIENARHPDGPFRLRGLRQPAILEIVALYSNNVGVAVGGDDVAARSVIQRGRVCRVFHSGVGVGRSGVAVACIIPVGGGRLGSVVRVAVGVGGRLLLVVRERGGLVN